MPVTPELLDAVSKLCEDFVAEWDEWAALQRSAYDTDRIKHIDDPAELAQYVWDNTAHRQEAKASSQRMINRFGHEVYGEALKHYGFDRS